MSAVRAWETFTGKVLVSACFLGEPVRYNGDHKALSHALLRRWVAEGRVVPHCPEVAGGLGVPRPRCEIQGGSGEDVLDGRARVMDEFGADRTEAFLRGAQLALDLCRVEGISLALLKENSPSCGSLRVGDGSFQGRRVAGQGVTSALLRRHGIRVIGEEEL
jgi:uncharacterized protein YbbK (DUF523 family)